MSNMALSIHKFETRGSSLIECITTKVLQIKDKQLKKIVNCCVLFEFVA